MCLMRALRRSWWWFVGAALVTGGAVVFGQAQSNLSERVLGVLAVLIGLSQAAWPFLQRWWTARGQETTAHAAVRRSATSRPRYEGPSGLLAPHRQVVPFVGRGAELDSLVAWCRTRDVPDPVRLITGPGGVGKSRLAAELSTRMSDVGWTCLDVADDQEAAILDRATTMTSGPVLLVVDYADARKQLASLLYSVAVHRGSTVRVLLLARGAGEWWERLRSADAGTRALVLSAYAGVDLPARVDDESDNQRIVRAAAQAFAEVLGITAPAVQVRTEAGSARMLDLHAAALVAVLRARDASLGRGTPQPVDVTDVLEELLQHEQRYWVGAGDRAGLLHGPSGLTIGLLQRIVAAASLLTPADETEAFALLRRVDSHVSTPKVIRWLSDLYPPRDDQQWLGTLQPDRMAELHVITELDRSHVLADACLRDLDARQARHAVALLTRAVADHYTNADALQKALRLLNLTIDNLPDDVELLRTVAAVIPHPSEALAQSNLAVLQRILDLLPEDDEANRSETLHDLAVRLHRLGRQTQAVGPLREAIEIRRRNSFTEPDGFLPLLANSLRYLGAVLSELGRATDALEPTLEAVAIDERLVAIDADAHQAHLARTLSDLGARFHEAGRAAEAQAPLLRAIEIQRRLELADPVRTRPHLARSLMNLSITYGQLGNPRDALPAIEEAVRIRQLLARENPDGDLVFLARALAEHSARLVEVGRPADGVAPALESVEIRRRLAADNPERHAIDLALSLRQAGTALRESGRLDESLDATGEAIAIQRRLVRDRPDHVTMPHLAESLADLSTALVALGRAPDALPPAEEAVTLLRWSSADGHDHPARPLARSLKVLASTLAALGRHPEALRLTSESAAVLDRNAGADKDRGGETRGWT